MKTKVKRNTQKVEFNNKMYFKSHLVLAVIKNYIEENKNVKFESLQKLFNEDENDKTIYKTYDIIVSTKDRRYKASKIAKCRRYHKETIKIKDDTIAVCNQFGIDNIDNFINNVNTKLNLKIETFNKIVAKTLKAEILDMNNQYSKDLAGRFSINKVKQILSEISEKKDKKSIKKEFDNKFIQRIEKHFLNQS